MIDWKMFILGYLILGMVTVSAWMLTVEIIARVRGRRHYAKYREIADSTMEFPVVHHV